MTKLRLLDIGSANPRLDVGWNNLSDIEIVMFEPDVRSLESMAKKSGVRIFTNALSAKEEKRSLYLTRKPELTSFYKPKMTYHNKFPDSRRWEIVDEINVECKSIKSLYPEIGEYDFIKIDTQGSELEILKGALDGGLELALGVESEVEFIELYEGQPLFSDVCQFMKGQGFEFYDFVVEYRYGRKELNRKGQLAFADALFLRTSEWVESKYRNGEIGINKIYNYMHICNVYGKTDLIEVMKEYLNRLEQNDGN
jgi:FkbM family methyltransferase